jgi:hypothetical protein
MERKMEMKAKWIWYYGEYEAYHNIMLHSRRENYGITRPAFWAIPNLYPNLEFIASYDAPEDFKAFTRVHGDGLIEVLDTKGQRFFPLNTEITLPAGKHTIKASVINTFSLPCLYFDSEHLVSDSSWTVTLGRDAFPVKAGCTPEYTSPDDDPMVFPFKYYPIEPISSFLSEDGSTVYDFGKESFALLVLKNIDPSSELLIRYGESQDEALSPTKEPYCMFWENVSGKTEASFRPRAFRYVALSGKNADKVTVSALNELLDTEIKGGFESDDPLVKKIWDTCAYTFHLCSREFYLDGIKRDRWVWGGDARQSFMINNYIFADREICKRSILALLPKDFVYQHVNTINDYSAYMIISVWEYYLSYGDVDFVRAVWSRVKLLYDYILSRLNDDGLVVARKGDWIFIDWSDIDKDGPLCAEQLLLVHTHRIMGKLASLLGEEDGVYNERADALMEITDRLYYREEKGAYIDSYTSGREHISRHASIFAILFDLVSGERKEILYKNVLCNDSVPPITTPYFKLYELMAFCSLGHIEEAQKHLNEYWGGMLELGATSIWEEYDPKKSIPECYAMYGKPYEKSLCHAWSCGPIYLLGRYCLGVYPTSVAYESYRVEPNVGNYTSFEGTVPTEKGLIKVSYRDGKITVLSELDGGTLCFNGMEYPIVKGVTLTV